MLNVFSRSSLRSVSRRCYHKISYDVIKSEIDLSGTIELTTKWDLTDAFEKVLINKPKMIKLIIDSPGGRTDVYKDILEQIKIMKKTRDFKLITVAKNDCSSAAIPIFAVGDYRISDPNCMFQFHYGQSIQLSEIKDLEGNNITDRVQIESSVGVADSRASDSFYANSIARSIPCLRKKVLNLMDQNSELNSKQALRFGLALTILPIKAEIDEVIFKLMDQRIKEHRIEYLKDLAKISLKYGVGILGFLILYFV